MRELQNVTHRHDRTSSVYRSKRPFVQFADIGTRDTVGRENAASDIVRASGSEIRDQAIYPGDSFGRLIRAIHTTDSLEGLIAGGIDGTTPPRSQRANSRFPAERRNFTRRIREISVTKGI